MGGGGKISYSKKGENYQGNWKCNGRRTGATLEAEPNSRNSCGRSFRF